MTGNERKLARVLARGGMLILRDDGYRVYRSADARRGCVGILSPGSVAQLKREGALVSLCPRNEYWRWQEGYALPSERGASEALLPRDIEKKRSPSKTVLEAVLRRVEEASDKERILLAARRFLSDYEAAMAGPSVTMNWSFEPGRNKARYGSACAGLPASGHSARAALRALSEALDARQFALVECALVSQHSQHRLSCDFGLTRPAMLEAVRRGLWDMAHVYDHKVRASV